MKCYFLRRTEGWKRTRENTDHPKALCPDKKKGIMNLFASHWESRTLNFSNKKHRLYLCCGVNQLHQRCRGRGGSQGNTWNTTATKRWSFCKWITYLHKILRKLFPLHFTSHSAFVMRAAVKDKPEFYHPG